MKPTLTPLERLLQEEVPVRPTAPTGGIHSVWTKADQDRHWADLAASVDMPGAKRPEPTAPVHDDVIEEAA